MALQTTASVPQLLLEAAAHANKKPLLPSCKKNVVLPMHKQPPRTCAWARSSAVECNNWGSDSLTQLQVQGC